MAEKANENNFLKSEQKLSAGESFKLFVYNPRTKEVLGRTGSSWLKILIFYIIFYLCLAAFWAVMLLIFYQTIDERTPKWMTNSSIIGSNPGLGYRPRPPPNKVKSTLIWFTSGPSLTDWNSWPKDLDEFLKPYKQPQSDSGAHNQGVCSGNQRPDPGKFCQFSINEIESMPNAANCTSSSDYGYRKGNPCVLIKLNRIYGWEPEPFNLTTMNEDEQKKLPKIVLDDLKNSTTDKIYITCEGENPADKENMGPIEYFPQPGIDFKYFPFTNQPGYLSPFVYVHFQKLTPGVLINIECKAWAKNIKHNRKDREGSVHFELLLDG